MSVWNYLDVFTPQLLLIVFALLMPAIDYISKDKRIISMMALAPLVAVAAALISWIFLDIWTPPESQISLIDLDIFAGLFMLVFVSVGIVVVLGSPEFIKNDKNQGEYYALILLAITGMTRLAATAAAPACPTMASAPTAAPW